MNLWPVDPDRRVLGAGACPYCGPVDCELCAAGDACSRHPMLLLGAKGHVVAVGCPSCALVWEWDTRRKRTRAPFPRIRPVPRYLS